MMYPYMTLSDETEIVHSQLIEDKGIKKVIVNFERPTDRKSTRLNSSHTDSSRMPSSA